MVFFDLRTIIKIAFSGILVLIILIIYLRMNALDPIFTQLKALQVGDTLLAYEQTSHQYRQTHSILKFANHARLLNSNSGIILMDQTIYPIKGFVKAKIITPFGYIIVIYHLIRETTAWKIQSLEFV